VREELPIFVKWIDFLKWLFLTTDKFPKKARFTFAERINNLALDIVGDLIEARYTKNKVHHLKAANLRLEKLRVLLRICYESQFLSHKGHEHAMYSINEVGKMLGGWMRTSGERQE
jgi:four helix bundle protein